MLNIPSNESGKMERQDLEAVVNSQKEQLSRYEKRLKGTSYYEQYLIKAKFAIISFIT